MTKRLRCPDCHTRKDVHDATGSPVACPECGADLIHANTPMGSIDP